jgi:hypothetical protein
MSCRLLQSLLLVLAMAAATLAAEVPAPQPAEPVKPAEAAKPPVAAADPAKPIEFDLKEVSAYALDKNQIGTSLYMMLLRGASCLCTSAPQFAPPVKAYPPLKSAKPLYGQIVFHVPSDAKNSAVPVYNFVIDESGGTGKGYDLLYIDRNRDLDLTNDKPVGIGTGPQTNLILPSGATWFEPLWVPWDYGQGARPFAFQPRLEVQGDMTFLFLVNPVARQGRMTVGGRDYDVLLGQMYQLSPRYDQPQTVLHIRRAGPLGPNEKPEPVGTVDNTLGQLRPMDGKWYGFAASPSGDKLILRPYQDELGVLAMGKGKREITGPLVMQGGLTGTAGDRWVSLPVINCGAPLAVAPKEPIFAFDGIEQLTLPVGDYQPSMMMFRLGHVGFTVSNNCHSDGKPMQAPQAPTFGIKIRPDKPFVLDFSNPAEVLFASPAKDFRLKPGQTLQIDAVLIDPVLNIMIRSLTAYTNEKPTGEDSESLTPKVVITNAAGKTLAEGIMPFG